MDHPPALSFDLPEYSSLAKNTLATFLGRLCAIGLGVLLSMVLFRALEPARYGLWSLLVLLSGYSMTFDFGLSAAVEQRVASLAASNDVAGIQETLNAALAVVFGAFLVLQVLATGAAWVLGFAGRWADVTRALVVLPACIGMTAGSLVVGAGLSGLQRMPTLHLWRSIGMTAATAATIALALRGTTRLDLLLVVYAAGGPLAAAKQWLSLRRLVRGLRLAPAWNRAVVGRLFRFGGVLQAATMAPVVADYVFRLVVGARFGIAYAGVYDLASRAGVALRSVAGALFTTMVPFGVHALECGDRDEASRLNRLAIKYTALLMLPASVLLFRYAGPLMHAWLGTAPVVLHVQHAFQALLAAHAIASLAVPAAMLGRSAARPGPEAVVTTLAAALGLAACLLAPGFFSSIVIFGFAPTLGALGIWAWITRRLGLRFGSGRDLAAIASLSVAGYVVAVVADRLLGPASVSGSLVAVAAGIAVAMLAVALLAHAGGVLNERERSLLWAVLSRTSASPGRPATPGID
jgi:O-antigen/teichoic acid export membrane protein